MNPTLESSPLKKYFYFHMLPLSQRVHPADSIKTIAAEVKQTESESLAMLAPDCTVHACNYMDLNICSLPAVQTLLSIWCPIAGGLHTEGRMQPTCWAPGG